MLNRLLPLILMALLSAPATSIAIAQAGASKTKTKPRVSVGTIKSLDERTLELQKNLLKDATEISKGYEDAGEYERAKLLLEVLQKLDPKLPGLKDKIEQLTDKALDAAEFEYELDVSRGWTAPVGVVAKDRLVRIEASGDYKFVATLAATADGLPADESGADLVGSVAVGALMGVIVPTDTKKPGKPFEIKSHREWTPNQSGYLQLRVNVPNGHKCTGKIKVKLSGVAKLST